MLAVAVALALAAAGFVQTPLLVAVALGATSLGVLVPVLKDAGRVEAPLGQLVIAGGSVADFAAIVLLTVLFAGEGGPGATVVLVAALVVLAAAVLAVVRGAERSMRIRADLLRLQDTTAQIRVRGAVLLLVGFAAAAHHLGLEVILGAFAAGAVLTLADPDEAMTHPDLRRKLEAIGFGVFIPVFFVVSGVRFDLGALTGSASALATVPLFLLALLVVRGLPALRYARLLDRRETVVAGLLQATSLPFLVTATAIGGELGPDRPRGGRRARRRRTALGAPLPRRRPRAAAPCNAPGRRRTTRRQPTGGTCHADPVLQPRQRRRRPRRGRAPPRRRHARRAHQRAHGPDAGRPSRAARRRLSRARAAPSAPTPARPAPRRTTWAPTPAPACSAAAATATPTATSSRPTPTASAASTSPPIASSSSGSPPPGSIAEAAAADVAALHAGRVLVVVSPA